MNSNDEARYAADALTAYAGALLAAAGVQDDIARDVAAVLVDGDLLGHTTHGLALLPSYLAELDRGAMRKSGAPSVENARDGSQTWDGQRLPGPWLTLRAIDTASEMAKRHGTGSVALRRSHHIACLEAYLMRATSRGLMAIIACSDSSMASVAPFGAVTPVLTPNPIAAGIPTSADPILIDISASITTNGMTSRLYKAGQKMPHAWALDAQGRATDDPAVLFEEPKGTLLPLGGVEAGHKGYALALLVEALCAGFSGFGRADPQEGWGASVFVQVLDPAAFAGLAAFTRQMDALARACREATPAPGRSTPRLPGERALALLREQRANGVALYRTILPALAPWAARYGATAPAPIR
jgi:L-lactate dehydrogenase